MSDLIQTSITDRVMTLRINRADKKNALTMQMYSDMANAITAANTNDEVRVLLIRGSDDCFCAGNDLADFMKAAGAQNVKHEDAPVFKFMKALSVFEKPVVAAVTGPAVGIGTTMLLHCDLVYAGNSTKLRMPFVNLGLCPEFASSYILPRIMGHQRAAELLYLSPVFTAEKAREYGLINEALEDSAVHARAEEVAKQLALQAPKSLRVTKQLLKKWSDATVADAIPHEVNHFMPMLKEGEAAEAITAAIQKRKPDFSKFS